MAENSKIEWTTHTFNPWMGCTKVHAGCTNCYAEELMDNRYGKVQWGPNGTRVRTADSNWKKPLQWNRAAEKAGERHRVFCASLADVFEDWGGMILDSNGQRLFSHVDINASAIDGSVGLTMNDMRADLFRLIDSTPHLDWLLLTKRPENVRRMWPTFEPPNRSRPTTDYAAWDNGHRPNVWIGTSVSDQATAIKAIPELLKCRDLSPVLFLSAEPLVGPVDLLNVPLPGTNFETGADVLRGGAWNMPGHPFGGFVQSSNMPTIDWVIVGGESGNESRPCDIRWIDSIVNQCGAASVPCFVKQLGAKPIAAIGQLRFEDKKGGDWDTWPGPLRVRQFPRVTVTT